ncbi:manganese-dependent ADP-ribose/CDP-alcohol diphosphatase isoform X1 [Megalops cyprinoides]|uniref:manganese-dependent ADP-ribose/CDP-alcohol diphosphatase isoform X1 n=1 Tax=Megalops cyprinoides TaxID=118141 RepID=UPI0018644B00|nr:manganese-dependent ADP-ribose/CDP-alcohol diphosphatase isoform X1 [Megalops cyprinoides]
MLKFKHSFRNSCVSEGRLIGWWAKGGKLTSRLTRTRKMDDSIQPLFTFGIIADIQYADIDDGFNFKRTRKRYYRNSLKLLRRANEKWRTEAVPPSFILQLGDIIDGFNKKYDASEKALETVVNELDKGEIEVHHVWGNHEFYNFSRDDLMSSALNSKATDGGMTDDVVPTGESAEESYAYHFSPAPRFRFVVLDAYDLSLIGRKEPSERYYQSLEIMQAHNNNDDLNHPPVSIGLEQRFVKFNGGFSQDQLDWLEGVLTLADEKLEKVIIVSHLPIHPNSTDPICLAWNYEKALSIIRAHKSVVCFMAGHDHDGGYYRDASGVHHLTLEGVIETPPDSEAFGTVYVYEDRMALKGNGRVTDRILMYP